MTDTVDLKSQEVQDAIAAAVEAAVDGLKTKNTELLGKLKKAQQGAAIDPADMAALESERDALKAQLSEANRASKRLATEAEAAAKRAEAAEGGMTKLLVENGLNDALAKAGVTNPVHQKAAKAMLATQVQIADDNGAKVPKVGEKALAEFITEWAGSDEGKHFVTAPDMAGGGAHGGAGASSTNNPFAKGEHFNLTEQAALLRTNPQLAASLQSQAS